MIVALDPGRNLGVAWVTPEGGLVAAKIVMLDDLEGVDWQSADTVVVGDGTGTAEVQERLTSFGVAFEVIDETGTTLEARRLFFADHPARGLERLLPPGLRAPQRPIDDYAAYAIGLRYLRWLAWDGSG